MYTISKEFKFCAAHRLTRDRGKCSRLHGHNYVAVVTLKSAGLNGDCMVANFDAVKATVGKWIDDNWDHRTILSPDDLELIDLLDKTNEGPYLVPLGTDPTAEVLARVLFEEASRLINPKTCGVSVTAVHIDETDTCSACYTGEE